MEIEVEKVGKWVLTDYIVRYAFWGRGGRSFSSFIQGRKTPFEVRVYMIYDLYAQILCRFKVNNPLDIKGVFDSKFRWNNPTVHGAYSYAFIVYDNGKLHAFQAASHRQMIWTLCRIPKHIQDTFKGN